MIKTIVEAPFHFVGWMFKDTYGRLFAILALALVVCLIDYPVKDTEIGVWEVEYTLKEQFSKEEGGPSYVDSANRIDPSATAERKDIRRISLENPWALITSPFHHKAERRVKLIWAVMPALSDAKTDGAPAAPAAEKAHCSLVSINCCHGFTNGIPKLTPNTTKPQARLSKRYWNPRHKNSDSRWMTFAIGCRPKRKQPDERRNRSHVQTH